MNSLVRSDRDNRFKLRVDMTRFDMQAIHGIIEHDPNINQFAVKLLRVKINRETIYQPIRALLDSIDAERVFSGSSPWPVSPSFVLLYHDSSFSVFLWSYLPTIYWKLNWSHGETLIESIRSEASPCHKRTSLDSDVFKICTNILSSFLALLRTPVSLFQGGLPMVLATVLIQITMSQLLIFSLPLCFREWESEL